MSKYILEFKYESGFNAGSKARDDVNLFLKDLGFRLVALKPSTGLVDKVLKPFTLFKELNTMENGSTILIQYPYYVQKWYFHLILNILKMKKVKTICLIHDLNSLRHQNGDINVNEELDMLNKFDVIISHNEKMTGWLKDKGILPSVLNLDIFDYQTEDFKVDLAARDKSSIAVAGNLVREKTGFIYRFTEDNLKDLTVNLYGVGYDTNNQVENLRYFGALPPAELPTKIKGGYGLIWDGPSLDSCEGEYGEYLKYNNPHKLSLYMASGMPVIVWKQAAIADFVENHQVGVAVDSIADLPAVLQAIDQNQYEQMLKNVQLIRKQVMEGYFITKAVKKCLELF